MPEQTDSAHDEHRAQQENPRFRRQEERADGYDSKDDENEAYVLSFLVFTDRFSLSIIISHKNTHFTLCEKKKDCYGFPEIFLFSAARLTMGAAFERFFLVFLRRKR